MGAGLCAPVDEESNVLTDAQKGNIVGRNEGGQPKAPRLNPARRMSTRGAYGVGKPRTHNVVSHAIPPTTKHPDLHLPGLRDIRFRDIRCIASQAFPITHCVALMTEATPGSGSTTDSGHSWQKRIMEQIWHIKVDPNLKAFGQVESGMAKLSALFCKRRLKSSRNAATLGSADKHQQNWSLWEASKQLRASTVGSTSVPHGC